MTDFLDERREEITSRLTELAPLVVEYGRLQAAVKALDAIPASSNGTSTPRPRAGRSQRRGRPRGAKPVTISSSAARVSASTVKPTAKAARGPRKGTGKRAAQAMTLIQKAPGVTIPELAAKMGTHPTYLYKVLPGLEKEGKVRKEGRGWHPAQ